MDTHECPGPGCKRQIQYVMLACGRHWRQVSPGTQREVYATWRRGEGAGTIEHLRAMDAAIAEMRA